jgi:hypothetical protein
VSRLAREHPDDEQYQSLEGQREALAEIGDTYEGRHLEWLEAEERRYLVEGPNSEERFNMGYRRD